MQIGILGINFKTAGLALHESIARSGQILFRENGSIPMVLLSTCNRAEIYFSAENLTKANEEIQAILQDLVGFPLNDLLYSYFEKDCFAHLCRVTSGLDSAIFLETEIARQVKVAYAVACRRSILPSALHYLFQKSFKIAKSLRFHFLSRNKGASLFGTLWQIAEEEFSDLRQKTVFLVGYSETHRRLADFLIQKGMKHLVFCSRQPEKVLGLKAVSRDALELWAEYDLISCASQADTFLIRGEGKKRHLIFDLSVPRNVDPMVESKNVKLFNIEQINRLIAQNKGGHQVPLEKLEAHLWEDVSRLSTIYLEKTSHFLTGGSL